MKRHIGVFVIFTLLSLSLFWPVFTGKVNLNGNLLTSFYSPYGENLPYKNTGWDQLRIYFPFYKFSLSEFGVGSIPLWNPYAFSGHPHAADFQSAVFYPLNIFGLFLDQIEFWHLLRISPSVLAGFFTFIFLRNWKMKFWPSMFGGIAFGFSPFIITWGEEVVMSPHSIAPMPLILFFLDKYFEKKRRVHLFGGALAWAASLLGGYMQTSIYLAIFVLAYLLVIYRPRVANFKLWAWTGLFFMLGTGVTALQLFPSGELFFNSARSSIRLTNVLYDFLLPFKSLITFLVPDFFGNPATLNFFRDGRAQYYEGILFAGVGVFVLGIYAFWFFIRDKKIMFLAGAFLISLSTVVAIPTSKLLLQLPIPFLSTSIANRVLFIPVFCLAVAGSFALNEWSAGKAKKLTLFVVLTGAFYLLLAFYLLGVKYFGFAYWDFLSVMKTPQLVSISLRNLVVPLSVFGTLFSILVLFKRKTQLGIILIIVVSFVHIFYFSNKYLTFNERKFIFPNSQVLDFIKQNQGNFRSWGVGKGFLENNFATQYGLYWPEGYDSLNNRSYGEFTYVMQGDKIEEFLFRADAGLGAQRGFADIHSAYERERLVDMVGVKYIVGFKDDFESIEKAGYPKVFESGNFAVFENLNVIPRAFLASSYEGPPDVNTPGETEPERREKEKLRRKLIFNKLLDPEFDIKNTIVLEKPSTVSPQAGLGDARIIQYKPKEVIVKTQSSAPKILVLTDNWFAGWKAEVDGNRTEILRADYTFRAVPLIAGEHIVRFYYDPISFKVGVLSSVVSLGVLVFLSFGSRKKLF